MAFLIGTIGWKCDCGALWLPYVPPAWLSAPWSGEQPPLYGCLRCERVYEAHGETLRAVSGHEPPEDRPPC